MNSRQSFLLLFVGLIVSCGIVPRVSAQPKPGYEPSSTHIFPAGGRRGSSVAVRVGTECAPPRTHFQLQVAGVRAPQVLGPEVPFQGEPSPRRLPTEIPITYPREWSTEIEIDEDAGLGPVYWRLYTGQGGTPSRPFIVGDLPEYVETESNSVPERAEQVTLPVTINGQICGERDVDYYRLTLTAGEVVSCEVFARRLGSPLEPLLELYTSDGVRLAGEETFAGNDPVTVFRVNQGGEYLLRMANISLQGSPACVYRVNLVKQPFLHYAYPPGGQAGQTHQVTLHVIAGDGQPRVMDAMIPFPDQPGAFEYRHPQLAGNVLLTSASGPVTIESEPNNVPDSVSEIALPASISGRLAAVDDEDWFRFTAEQGTSYTITCQPSSPGGPCLPTLVVTDAKGTQLARVRSVDSRHAGCRMEWVAPEDGAYAIRVRDLRHGALGGEDFVYRLTVTAAEADFALQLASDNANLSPGASTELEVALSRSGGFSAAVALRFEGLPEGVTVENSTIAADQNSIKVKLSASDDARPGSSTVRLVGLAEARGAMVQRAALAAHLGTDSEGVGVGAATVDCWHLTISHKPVFRLYCSEAYQYAPRGTVYPYSMQVERLDGFDGQVTLQLGDRQNRDLDGIEMIETHVPPGRSEVIMPIYLPETMHINVQSQSQLYTQGYALFTDKFGQEQSVLVLSEKRNMIRTLPPVVKLETIDTHLNAAPGDTVSCRLRLERTSNFSEPMELELLGPVPEGITVEPASIGKDQEDARINVHVGHGVSCPSPVRLTFRAIGKLTENMLVVSENTAQLRLKK